jgi:hypothetical protein
MLDRWLELEHELWCPACFLCNPLARHDTEEQADAEEVHGDSKEYEALDKLEKELDVASVK